MYQIVPAILEYDEAALKQRIEMALSLSAKTIHIDIIDSSFSQKTTVPKPEIFASYTTKAMFEVHLMVVDPLKYVKAYSDAGFGRFIGHVEHMLSVPDFIQNVRGLGKEAFLGIDFNTTVIDMPLNTYITVGLSGVTIMTIHAGLSGQDFQVDALQKVSNVRNLFPNLTIEVDGAMGENTISSAKQAGANLFAVNSALFKSKDPKKAFSSLQLLTHG